MNGERPNYTLPTLFFWGLAGFFIYDSTGSILKAILIGLVLALTLGGVAYGLIRSLFLTTKG